MNHVGERYRSSSSGLSTGLLYDGGASFHLEWTDDRLQALHRSAVLSSDTAPSSCLGAGDDQPECLGLLAVSRQEPGTGVEVRAGQAGTKLWTALTLWTTAVAVREVGPNVARVLLEPLHLG